MYFSILLYADDAKIFKRINCMLDCVLFQRDLDSMHGYIWCDFWQLKLNISKCTYVRFGLVDRPIYEYSISGTLLQKVVSTKDLGIIFDSKLSFSDHCPAIASKGFARVNLLRSFHSRDRDLQIKLFNCYVRPSLKFNSPIWSLHLKHDIVAIN